MQPSVLSRYQTQTQSVSHLATHGVYVPHFENLAPVLIQQDCRAVRFLVHTPKTKMDLQADLLSTLLYLLDFFHFIKLPQ